MRRLLELRLLLGGANAAVSRLRPAGYGATGRFPAFPLSAFERFRFSPCAKRSSLALGAPFSVFLSAS
jgi:hypothetical protein